MEIIRQNLFNQRVAGASDRPLRAHLHVRRPPRARVCRGTFFLPKGRLVVGGSLLYRQFFELAVLGGTGLFDNARGSLVSTRMRRSSRFATAWSYRLVG